MEVDDHRFKSARNKIFYVASRIQGPAFTHIEWEDIFTLVLNRIFVFIAENPTIESSIAQPPKPAYLKGNCVPQGNGIHQGLQSPDSSSSIDARSSMGIRTL
ncbi:hypothetical protein V8E54_005199 [Elaphomyces granulatus]|jgi:hypothetical protein